jgi:hypothetical protein
MSHRLLVGCVVLLCCDIICASPIGSCTTCKMEIFVLGISCNKVTLCTVNKPLLTSNNITATHLHLFLKKQLHDVNLAIASAVIGKTMLDKSEYKTPGLSALQINGCIKVIQRGVLLHEYQLTEDGTLGKMTGYLVFKVDMPFPEVR